MGEKQNGEYPCAWTSVRFRADPRLASFRPVTVKTKTTKGKNKGQEAEKAGYEWYDRHLTQWRSVQLSGLKLMLDFSPDRSVCGAHLLFTCDVESLPLSEAAKQTKSEETGETTKSGKKKWKKKIADGLVMVSVDLGLRHIGFAALGRWSDKQLHLLRSRSIQLEQVEETGRHPGCVSAGPDLRTWGDTRR